MDNEKCLRCGAPHEPDATVCLTCGAPIGETRSSTQPVRAVKVPRDEPAPATPESAPEADPSRVRTLAGPAIASRPVAIATSARRGPSARLIAIVFVIVLALAGGAIYAAHVLTAGPPISHQSVYHDPQHRFSFTRPTLWQVTATPNGALLTDSDGASTAKISVSAPANGQDAAAYADSLAQPQGLTSGAQEFIAGEEWEDRTGDVTGTDGAVREVVVLVTLHGGQLYTIELSSPTASFSGVNNLVYQPLLASFQFA